MFCDLYQPRMFAGVRLLLYGHYRILYLPQQGGDIYIRGVFHGALEPRRHLEPKGKRP